MTFAPCVCVCVYHKFYISLTATVVGLRIILKSVEELTTSETEELLQVVSKSFHFMHGKYNGYATLMSFSQVSSKESQREKKNNRLLTIVLLICV